MASLFRVFRFLPLCLGAGYLTVTIVLFFAGPFDWPIDNSSTMALFLCASLVSICVGFTLGSLASPPAGGLRAWRFCFRLGALASIALLIPSTLAYTGKWPWEIGTALGDQGAAYREMLAALDANESGIRPYVSLARAAFAPFIFCVIPFSILNWEHLRRTDFALLLLHTLSIIVFSLMRGTDRETIDLLLIVGGTLFVRLGRLAVAQGRFPFSLSRATLVLLFAGVTLFGALALFVDRKESRLGGNEAFCIGEQVVCSTRDANQPPILAKGMFGLEMLTAYMSQGYYGLSLALDAEFSWTYGLGHSAFLMSNVASTVDESLYHRSYMAKINASGWDDKAQWSTIFPWIASDVSFPAVPFAMAIFAFVWGAAWKSSVLSRSDTGALVFLHSCILVLYIPANNQLAQTLDSYFSAVLWFFFWLLGSKLIFSSHDARLQRGNN